MIGAGSSIGQSPELITLRVVGSTPTRPTIETNTFPVRTRASPRGLIMYSIVHIIYGLPLVESITKRIDELEARSESEDDLDEQENWWEGTEGPCGFETFYDGSAEYMPGFCGVQLDEFNACSEPFALSDLTLAPSPQQIDDAKKKIDALPKWVKKMYDELEMTPDVYIVFSTS